MLKYLCLFFSVTLLLSSCTGNQQPDGIIPHDQMVNVLIDIHIVDGGIYTSMSQNPDTLYKQDMGRYMALFRRDHIDSAQFRKSLKYYTDKPTELSLIYADVMTELQKKIDSLNKSMYNKPNAASHLNRK